MKIRLEQTYIENLNFSKSEKIEEDELTFSCSNGYSDSAPTFFIVKFTTSVESSSSGYKLDLDFVAEFETDNDIDDEFKSSQFPVVNAPAIAYPFLRAFVSNFTLNAGFEPVILPTINFQAMAKKE